MSENDIDLTAELKEKMRLNQLGFLDHLGYKGDASKMSLEQIEARIEVLKENKANEDPEPEPVIFKGVDGERKNIEQINGPRTFKEITANTDSLSVLYPILKENVNLYDGNSRVVRLNTNIKLNEHKTVIRRAVL